MINTLSNSVQLEINKPNMQWKWNQKVNVSKYT